MFTSIYTGTYDQLDVATRQFLNQKNIPDSKIHKFVAQPNWTTYLFAIALLPIIALPIIAIVAMITTPEEWFGMFILLIVSTPFVMLIGIAWSLILSRGIQYIVITPQAFIEKRRHTIVILPFADIIHVKVRMNPNGLATLDIFIKGQQNPYTIMASRSTSPFTTAVNPFTYRFHLIFSIFKLNYHMSLLELKRMMIPYLSETDKKAYGH